MPFAEDGNPDAQAILGEMYFEGNGLNKDLVKALEWYKKAAIQGDSSSMSALLLMDEQKDYTTLLEDFSPLAEQGNKHAQLIVADFFYSHKKDNNTALTWFRKSAEQGQPEAQFRLGLMIENGQGILKNDEEAADWYLKSALESEKLTFGISMGVASLGKLLIKILEENPHHNGHWFSERIAQRGIATAYTISKTPSKAIEWFLKAAEQGDIESQKELAARYFIGRDTTQNYRKAFYWFLKAASLGDATSQFDMAGFYARGFASIPKNLVLAHMLYNLAGAKSYRTAITNQRDEIALLLTPNQLDEAQELASKWKIGMPIPNTTKTYPLTSKAQRRKK